MADEVGCSGVVVDAKAGAIEFYAKYGFTPFVAIEGESECFGVALVSEFAARGRAWHGDGGLLK